MSPIWGITGHTNRLLHALCNLSRYIMKMSGAMAVNRVQNIKQHAGKASFDIA